jgi:hypothetical protein
MPKGYAKRVLLLPGNSFQIIVRAAHATISFVLQAWVGTNNPAYSYSALLVCLKYTSINQHHETFTDNCFFLLLVNSG